MPELAEGSAPFTISLPERVAHVVWVVLSLCSSGADAMFEQAARVREAVKKKILKNFFNIFFTL